MGQHQDLRELLLTLTPQSSQQEIVLADATPTAGYLDITEGENQQARSNGALTSDGYKKLDESTRGIYTSLV